MCPPDDRPSSRPAENLQAIEILIMLSKDMLAAIARPGLESRSFAIQGR